MKKRNGLLAILKEAAEHLDYCGYGDSWEREVADEAKLRERIDSAITKAEKGNKPMRKPNQDKQA